MNKRLAIALSAAVIIILAGLLFQSFIEPQNAVTPDGSHKDILDYSAKPYDNTVTLSIITNGTIPKLTDNTEGFGYGWLGIRKDSDHFKSGPGHLTGYIVYAKDSKLVSSSVALSQVHKTKTYCADLSIENNGKTSINGNEITLEIDTQNIAESVIKTPYYFIDRAVYLKTIPESNCHGNLGLEIINTMQQQYIEELDSYYKTKP